MHSAATHALFVHTSKANARGRVLGVVAREVVVDELADLLRASAMVAWTLGVCATHQPSATPTSDERRSTDAAHHRERR